MNRRHQFSTKLQRLSLHLPTLEFRELLFQSAGRRPGRTPSSSIHILIMGLPLSANLSTTDLFSHEFEKSLISDEHQESCSVEQGQIIFLAARPGSQSLIVATTFSR